MPERRQSGATGRAGGGRPSSPARRRPPAKAARDVGETASMSVRSGRNGRGIGRSRSVDAAQRIAAHCPKPVFAASAASGRCTLRFLPARPASAAAKTATAIAAVAALGLLRASLRRRARERYDVRNTECGSVTIRQRSGGAANPNVDFHALVIDGVCVVPPHSPGAIARAAGAEHGRSGAGVERDGVVHRPCIGTRRPWSRCGSRQHGLPCTRCCGTRESPESAGQLRYSG